MTTRGSLLGGRYFAPCYVYIFNKDISDCSNGQLSGACLACPIATPLPIRCIWLSFAAVKRFNVVLRWLSLQRAARAVQTNNVDY